MIVSLQVAAIAGLMAVASTPVMAQTLDENWFVVGGWDGGGATP
jgi:hypothetical protein